MGTLFSDEIELTTAQNDKETTKIHHQNQEILAENKEDIGEVEAFDAGITNYSDEKCRSF